MRLFILCMTIHTSIEDEIKSFLDNFFNNDKSLMTTRLLYLYGMECTGKTTFVKDVLKKLNYEMIYYNSIDLKSCPDCLSLSFRGCSRDMSPLDLAGATHLSRQAFYDQTTSSFRFSYSRYGSSAVNSFHYGGHFCFCVCFYFSDGSWP